MQQNAIATPGPRWGELQRSPRTLAGFKEPHRGGHRGSEGRGGKGRRGAGGREESWNRAADFLRSALVYAKQFTCRQQMDSNVNGMSSL